MGSKLCTVCYAHTTTLDDGLICKQHLRQAVHEAEQQVARRFAEALGFFVEGEHPVEYIIEIVTSEVKQRLTNGK